MNNLLWNIHPNMQPSHLTSTAWITPFNAPLSPSRIGPLSGLRFAVKDNIDVASTQPPAPVRRLLLHAHCARQCGAALAQRRGRSGGKDQFDQFACGLNGTRSPMAQCPMPFNPAYVSGGSSSGSAYVVATGQVDFALAPTPQARAACLQVLKTISWALKPSKGLISTRGVVPAAQSVDCVSIFARTVDMAAQSAGASHGV